MHTVIYIPGLGDSRVAGQQLAVRTWRLWGVNPELFQMNWADGEAFAPKFDRLLKQIDAASKRGSVSIVCASAGATAAMNAFAARKMVIVGVVCIAGKINNPHAIGDYYRRTNPAFPESAHAAQEALNELTAHDRSKILSIRGMVDPWVPARDSILEGAKNRMTWTSGHALTIGWQLVIGAPFWMRFLKQQQKQL
jgi:hypothetical protein